MIRLGVEIIRRMISSKQVFDKALFSATSFIKGSLYMDRSECSLKI
jgi:hypothetical protein